MNEISRSQGGPGLRAIVVLGELPEAQRFSDAEPLPSYLHASLFPFETGCREFHLTKKRLDLILISFLMCLSFVYRKATDFCMLIFYPLLF